MIFFMLVDIKRLIIKIIIGLFKLQGNIKNRKILLQTTDIYVTFTRELGMRFQYSFCIPISYILIFQISEKSIPFCKVTFKNIV